MLWIDDSFDYSEIDPIQEANVFLNDCENDCSTIKKEVLGYLRDRKESASPFDPKPKQCVLR